MGYASSKFKVGDKVRVLDASAIDCSGQDYYDGMRTEVIAVDREGDVYLCAQDGSPGIHVDETEFHAIEKIDGGDTMNYRTVKRKARVGERILITDAGHSSGYYNNGDVLTVSKLRGSNAVDIKEYSTCPFIYDKEYEVIVEEYPTERKPAPKLNGRITVLEAEVAELKAKVQTLEKPDKPSVTNVTVNAGIGECAAETGRKFAEAMAKVGLCGKSTSMKTPNQQRKSVIERAKAFVEDVEERSCGQVNSDGNYVFNRMPTKITFHVNAEKRVVTALAHGSIDGKLVKKAFTKCAPDDVFNADIGKAIAAGRLYGLDVTRFEQAVQPTEVVVGMRVVTYLDVGAPFKSVVPVRISRGYRMHEINDGERYTPFNPELGDHITDDTEAQY